MTRRLLTTLVLAVLALAGLTACRTNVGVAARVDGRTITESQVDDYVSPSGVDPALAAQAKQANQDIVPRVQALQILVSEQVFEDTLRSRGGVPSESALRASHDAAAQQLGQGQQSTTPLLGADYDKSLRADLKRAGLSAGLLPRYLRLQELEHTLIERFRLVDSNALLRLTAAAARKVSVSPRYGTWDASQLTIDSKAGTPAYLQLQSSAAPTATTP